MGEEAPPTSWLMLEAGWPVVGAGGEELGTLDEVIGDSGKDIFGGIAVSTGMLRPRRYVPAARVARIEEGRVLTDLSPEAFARLEEYGGAPPSARIQPD